MIDLDIDFNKSDLKDFSGVMNRLQKECGWSPARAGTYAFINVLKSMRASTKRSKKKRKVKVASRKRKGRTIRRFEVENYKAGEKQSFYIYAGSLAEAKKSNAVNVHYAGLAKASFGWAMRDVFNQGSAGKVGFRRPSGVVSGYARTKKGSFSAVVENKVRYIRSAFVTSGSRVISTAMQRANKGMINRIEKDLIKAAAR